MKEYESIEETLLFYGVKVCEPYYISTGKENLKFPERPFRMDFYAFCICISGYIDLEIDNKKFTVSQNGFLVSAPSTVVRFLSHSKNFRMKLLFFDKNFLLKNIGSILFIMGKYKNIIFVYAKFSRNIFHSIRFSRALVC